MAFVKLDKGVTAAQINALFAAFIKEIAKVPACSCKASYAASRL